MIFTEAVFEPVEDVSSPQVEVRLRTWRSTAGQRSYLCHPAGRLDFHLVVVIVVLLLRVNHLLAALDDSRAIPRHLDLPPIRILQPDPDDRRTFSDGHFRLWEWHTGWNPAQAVDGSPAFLLLLRPLLTFLLRPPLHLSRRQRISLAPRGVLLRVRGGVCTDDEGTLDLINKGKKVGDPGRLVRRRRTAQVDAEGRRERS